ncbi:hypothetical protein ACIBH1_05825 [Nonomuraea sp. NPDC050663]|uniref:hypothetical protein n=1 Tax=Nonomuraea sp. NPDC050663 TaxID=3364370 RepID=UPI0037BAD8ED
MSHLRPDEHGDILRRVLRAEADQVVPSPEGLEIIRDRIARRGVRNLFWWRAGAAGASAVLVAASVVMIVPEWRESVVTTVVNWTDDVKPTPSSESTSRPKRSERTPSEQNPPPVNSVATPEVVAPTQPVKAPQTAGSTTKPSSPSPSPTPTCPTQEEDNADDCPEESPDPTPSETVEPEASCPVEECPPEEPPMTPEPSEFYSPLVQPSG